ncbi:hypothetical protein CBOM_00296 [Ceraceosorus bombacis]|uniref:Uncharacterized protein n=1 Tax=Ceraceosorus bombacis TaxID=401625 RepID=A0A0P1B9G0_9BASI|nr:hypothetical protein CBOM_00296 [Ceraceosorus bombacis]
MSPVSSSTPPPSLRAANPGCPLTAQQKWLQAASLNQTFLPKGSVILRKQLPKTGVIITFFVPNYYLGTQHNHVSKRDLDDNDVGGPVVRDTSNEAPPTTPGQKAWRAIRDAWDFPPRKPLAA